MKITTREKGETIFTRARASLALLSLRTNGWFLGVADTNDVIQKIEKTLNNTHTTTQKLTNNSFRNTKKHPTNGRLLVVYASRGFSLAWLLAFTKSFAWVVCRVKATQERTLSSQGMTGRSKQKSVNTAGKNALISVKLRSLKVIC